LNKLLEHLALCISFFSRIPLPAFLGNKINDDSKLTDAVIMFPITGFGIGIVPALIWYVASLYLPPLIAAGLAIGIGLLISGALHEDGLADCADGFGGGRDSTKVLDIMRDSTIGTYGGAALIMSIGLRWTALASFGPITGALALLIAHSGSRSVMPIAMEFSQYARSKGLGQMASGDLPDLHFLITLAIAFAFAFLLGFWPGVVAVTIAMFLGWSFLKYAEHRIGGYTGDVFGAMQQIAEITILITLAGIWT